MAKQGDVMDDFENRGEQNLDFPMAICPNQSLLVEELKSKFEGIDRRFYTLFERLNDNSNFNANTVPKPATPNPTAHIICRQISKVLQQWTGRHTQNYFELKHISQLLNAFAEDCYQGNGLRLILQRAREVLAASKMSWNFVPKSTVSGDLRDFGFCVDPPKISFRSSRPFRRGCRLGMQGPVVRKGHLNHQTTNSLHEVLNVSLWTVQFH